MKELRKLAMRNSSNIEKPRLSKKPRVFYGYWIVVATFVLTLVHGGCGFFAFSLFVKPLQADLGWSRGETMTGWTAYYLLLSVSSPFLGRLVDHYDAKKVIFIGALIGSLGFILLSLVNNLWQFYVGYAVVGVGMAAIGYIPATAVVSNWFTKRRGTAIGIMSAGIGAGGLAVAPFVGGYLIPNFGWKVSYLALAIIVCVVVVPLALLIIKTRPADMGLYPDGVETPETNDVTETSVTVSDGLPLKMSLATLAFWLIAISFMSSSFSQVGIIQNQVPHLEDIGFPVALAATALGVLGLASAIGKFGFGWLCDRIPAKYACAIGLGFQAVGIIVFMNIGPASPSAIIWLYAIMIGLGAGSWLPTLSMLTSSNFGLATYGAIFGVLCFFMGIGDIAGPAVAGYMYDIMDTYHWAFIIFLALYAVAIPTILVVRRPKSLQNFKGE